MDEKVKLTEAFQAIKNVIIAQNQTFIRDLARKFHKNPDELCKKYNKPEYYLPMVDWNKNLNDNKT